MVCARGPVRGGKSARGQETTATVAASGPDAGGEGEASGAGVVAAAPNPTAGTACEVVVAGLNKHAQHAEVAEKACMACISLATGHLENAGKLVIAGACPGSITFVCLHYFREW